MQASVSHILFIFIQTNDMLKHFFLSLLSVKLYIYIYTYIVVVSAVFSVTTHHHLATKFKFKMKYVPSFWPISFENFRPGLNLV